MSSAKEPVTFKLNTPRELSLLHFTYDMLQEGLEHDQITLNQVCNKIINNS